MAVTEMRQIGTRVKDHIRQVHIISVWGGVCVYQRRAAAVAVSWRVYVCMHMYLFMRVYVHAVTARMYV